MALAPLGARIPGSGIARAAPRSTTLNGLTYTAAKPFLTVRQRKGEAPAVYGQLNLAITGRSLSQGTGGVKDGNTVLKLKTGSLEVSVVGEKTIKLSPSQLDKLRFSFTVGSQGTESQQFTVGFKLGKPPANVVAALRSNKPFTMEFSGTLNGKPLKLSSPSSVQTPPPPWER